MDFTTTVPPASVVSAPLDAAPTTSGAVAKSVQAWEAKIRHAQSSRATPEILARVRQANERQRSALTFKKKAMRLERTNMLNCAQSAMTLQAFSRATPAVKSAHTLYEESSKRNEKYSKGISNCLSRTKEMSAFPPNAAAVFASDGCEENDSDLDELEMEMQADQDACASAAGAGERVDAFDSTTIAIRNVFGYGGMGAAQQAQVASSMTAELHALLEQLAAEPTNDAETAAKFLLFENFLSNVTAIREETISFWNSSKDQFVGSTRTAGDSDIQGIDSEDGMGIQDDPRKWFVYSMTKKASDNSTRISQILAGFRARLDLLSHDIGECPYCLEQMQLENSTILGCCHRVCTDCWTHWVEMKREAAFCPLCRHEEFIAEVLR
jgi:hypothetical protein